MSHTQMLIRHDPDYKAQITLVLPQRPLEMSLFVNCATFKNEAFGVGEWAG